MKILIVDDHALFREGLRLLLDKIDDLVECEEAEDCDTALSCMRNCEFNVVLLDLHMPGVDGLDALGVIRNADPTTPVVVLSGEESPSIVRATIDAGAMGFIHKSSHSDDLIMALKLILAGGVYLPPAVLTKPTSTEAVGLTDREKQVFRLLVEGKPNKLIGRNLDISENTVKAHLTAIYRALGAKNRTEAVFEAAHRQIL